MEQSDGDFCRSSVMQVIDDRNCFISQELHLSNKMGMLLHVLNDVFEYVCIYYVC